MLNVMSGQVALVVDDDPVIQRVVGFWLLDAGFSIMSAGSAEEALKMLGDRRPDVVVTDFRLPGISGSELAHRIKTETESPPPVFMMSAYPQPVPFEGDRFFSKPDQLIDMIRSIAGYA